LTRKELKHFSQLNYFLDARQIDGSNNILSTFNNLIKVTNLTFMTFNPNANVEISKSNEENDNITKLLIY
jgi:hypothetical protein